mmetsp:Transcript_5265/g.10047  ORF Transcript_5265/g.10047 Transcript_5265/m.10047 type:complete len:324 (+) Transcript_5265:725-1696(+)
MHVRDEHTLQTREHALSEHPRNGQPSRGLCGVEDAQQLQRVILNHSVLMNMHDMGGTTRLRNLVGGLRHELPQRQRLRHLPDEPVHLEEAYQAPYKEPHPLRRDERHRESHPDAHSQDHGEDAHSLGDVRVVVVRHDVHDHHAQQEAGAGEGAEEHHRSQAVDVGQEAQARQTDCVGERVHHQQAPSAVLVAPRSVERFGRYVGQRGEGVAASQEQSLVLLVTVKHLLQQLEVRPRGEPQRQSHGHRHEPELSDGQLPQPLHAGHFVLRVQIEILRVQLIRPSNVLQLHRRVPVSSLHFLWASERLVVHKVLSGAENVPRGSP